MANRFWVGGTGTWDASDTTHWSTTTGGGGGASVPGSSDIAIFDGSSGGGTVTVNFGGLITLQSITSGAFTGTLDFSANNNSVTLTANAGMNGTGSGTRTINLGNGTWTISASSGTWNFSIVTGLTFNANSSTIILSATTSSNRTFQGGGLTYNVVTFAANASFGYITVSGPNTFATLNISAPNAIVWTNGTTQTITNAFTWTGSSSGQIFLNSSSITVGATISVAAGSPTMSWAAPRLMTFSGGATFTATDSFDLGNNTGITITPPIAVRPTYALGI